MDGEDVFIIVAPAEMSSPFSCIVIGNIVSA
ncbi:hypothetical protein EPIR_3551 [Erwinia piriflorinigrans CFBP 5888]|uniref:Uncharacterized protein n=1 Tax=Erwinia piriflorinigrans CFBP 5888 TaxID=1161919 RepID=V5ZD43_9GAMM|nr:hypothetical protein EPIR_3551 [Erwinia piriflorinigrans CFBP 5888]